MPKLVEQYLAGQLKVDEFVTHTMPLVDINRAFDLMHQGERYSAVTLLNTLIHTHWFLILPSTAFVQLFSFKDKRSRYMHRTLNK